MGDCHTATAQRIRPVRCRGFLVLSAVATLILVLLAVARAQQKVLYEGESSYNTIVVTEDSHGLRTLRFEQDGVRQSVVKVGDPDHLELPYARAMPVGLALVERPNRMLIVGLGGGTIPSFLHKHYPRATIDVVDIDPDVVKVARRFFGFREDSTLHAHVADGRQFIERCRKPYDVIFLDAYGPESIPYSLATREFLQTVRGALAPRGVVVANLFGSHSNSLYESMVRTYQDVFDQVCILDVRGAGNKILLALPRKGRITQADLARRAGTISRQKRFPFDMKELVTYGFRHAAQEVGSDGRVLTDASKPRMD